MITLTAFLVTLFLASSTAQNETNRQSFTCPVYGPVRYVSYDLLLKPSDHKYGPIRDELRTSGGLWNIFVDYQRKNPSWAASFTSMYNRNLLNVFVNPRTGQEIFYRRRSNGVAHYVVSVVRPNYIGTGQDTTGAARTYTNSLVTRAGINGGTSQNQFASFDAGHILGNQLGGPVMTFNLFPQHGQINRQEWRVIEGAIADRIRRQGLTAVAEYYLEYDNYATVPSYLHYSFRLFDRNGNFVQWYNGLIVNLIPTGRRVVTRQIELGQTSSSGNVLWEETSTTSGVPSDVLQGAMGLQLLSIINNCNW